MKIRIIPWIILFTFVLFSACNPSISQILPTTYSERETSITTTLFPLSPTNETTASPSKIKITPLYTASITSVQDELLLTVGSPIDITWIDMIDSQNGWAIGGPYTSGLSTHILRTQNGGKSWFEVTPMIENQSARTMPFMGFAYNNDFMWAIEGYQPNLLWRTNNGGKTWHKGKTYTEIFDFNNPIILTFADSNNGWLMGSLGFATGTEFVNLYKTTDSGMNWKEITYDENSDIQRCHKYGLVFADKMHGWYMGNCSGQFPIMGNTNNGGLSWKEINLESIIGKKLFLLEYQSCFMVNPVIRDIRGITGISCRYYNENKFSEAYILLFNIYGTDWIYREYPGGNLYTLDGTRIWAVDNSFTHSIFRSDDAGRNWSRISTIDWIRSMDFVSYQIGWAVNSTGTDYGLIHTENGGESWTSINPVITALP